MEFSLERKSQTIDPAFEMRTHRRAVNTFKQIAINGRKIHASPIVRSISNNDTWNGKKIPYQTINLRKQRNGENSNGSYFSTE